MLFSKTRQEYNVHIFNKIIFFNQHAFKTTETIKKLL